jgi:myo-inositol-1(or 4)-monophosphatase
MFTAVKGGQAKLNGRRIAASEDKISEFSSIGLDSHYNDGVPAWTSELMRRTKFRNLGTTALQFAYVAKGSLIATFARSPRLWDIAAGALIAATAGAVVSDLQGGKIFPVDVDSYEDAEFKIIAANKKVHSEILELLK